MLAPRLALVSVLHLGGAAHRRRLAALCRPALAHRLERVGGVSYTVKDGIVYDAKKLLAEVADMVAAEKKKRGLPDPLYRP